MLSPRVLINGSLTEQADVDQAWIESHMKPYTLRNGQRVNLVDTREGKETIVFLPMLAEVNLVYSPQIEFFRNDYRIIVYEPGVRRNRRFGINDRAAELKMILDSLEIDRAHIVAWSDTCSTAYQFAKVFPEKCQSVVFMGIADRYILPEPYLLLAKMMYILPLQNIFPPSISARLLSKCLSGRHIRFEWLYRRARSIPRFSHLLKHSILPNLLEHKPNANEVMSTSLILDADTDVITTPLKAMAMSRLLPNCKGVWRIEGAEHFFPFSHGDEVNKRIKQFFSELRL